LSRLRNGHWQDFGALAGLCLGAFCMMPYLKEIEELFHAGNDHPSESAKAACLIEQCHTVSKNVKVMFHVVSLNAG
jgi:hypothetical protein